MMLVTCDSCCHVVITNKHRKNNKNIQQTQILNTESKKRTMLYNIARDIPLTLGIKRVYNLPPHLSYVSTLPEITQNRNRTLTS